MDTIQLTHDITQNITILPNEFIDQYMTKADGEFVKIYLLILRLGRQNLPIDPDLLADTLQVTRKDILRAVSYWEKEGLLSCRILKDSPDCQEDASSALPTNVIPKKPTLNAEDLSQSIQGRGLEQLVFMAETYIGHPLSVQELNSICYISRELHFSTDLLEYLVESCAEKGKTQIRYMEKVAVNWYQQGIDTVKKAVDRTTLYSQSVFSVMKAFGISGRNPGQMELDYINHWNSLGLGTEMISEACNRTLMATHQASFPYANRILEDWSKAGVKDLSDVQALDRQHRSAANSPGAKGQRETGGPAASNSFHNFDQRDYDYDELASMLTGSRR